MRAIKESNNNTSTHRIRIKNTSLHDCLWVITFVDFKMDEKSHFKAISLVGFKKIVSRISLNSFKINNL